MKFIDLTGQKFGRLTVIKQSESIQDGGRPRICWLCRCECGNEVIVRANKLKTKHTRSCGCLHKEITSKIHITKHQETKTRLYGIWSGMKQRCKNKKSKQYENYGKRGITVCEEWEKYENFRDWAKNSGYKESLTLDRINVNLGYSPENCRWADWKTQERNKRTNRLLSLNGETHCVKEWEEILNLPRNTIYRRLKKGLSIEEALKPKRRK